MIGQIILTHSKQSNAGRTLDGEIRGTRSSRGARCKVTTTVEVVRSIIISDTSTSNSFCFCVTSITYCEEL